MSQFSVASWLPGGSGWQGSVCPTLSFRDSGFSHDMGLSSSKVLSSLHSVGRKGKKGNEGVFWRPDLAVEFYDSSRTPLASAQQPAHLTVQEAGQCDPACVQEKKEMEFEKHRAVSASARLLDDFGC